MTYEPWVRNAHLRAAVPHPAWPTDNAQAAHRALSLERPGLTTKGFWVRHSDGNLVGGRWLTPCFYKLPFTPTALSQTYMVSESQKLHSQLPHGQTAGTMAATPWWHLTCTCLTGALMKGAPNPPAPQFSACLWPMSAVTVDLILCGGMDLEHSRESRLPKKHKESCWQPLGQRQAYSSLLLQTSQQLPARCPAWNTRPLRLPRALAASMPPALKSSLLSP